MFSPISSMGSTFLGGGHLSNKSNHRKRSAYQKQMRNAIFQSVSLNSEFQKVDSRGLVNPYSHKFSDSFMQKETAPNYYPPLLRKQMNEFMNKTSIRMEGPQAPASAKKKLEIFQPEPSELQNINQFFSDTFKIKKVKNSAAVIAKQNPRITPIQAKIIASQLDFGQS